MSKELDEFYKSYSARLIAVDDTPLVEVMDGGKFKLLSIEEYEEMANKITDLEAKLAESEKSKESYRLQNEQHHLQLLQFYSRLGVEAFGADIHEKALETLMIMKEQLAESEKENKTLKDIRTLERVVPRNAQLNKLSNRDCYLKGFENAISETIRTFEETYGKEKCKLIEERDKYLMDIVKAGGYEYQIEELKQQLAENEKEISEYVKIVDDLHKQLSDKCDFCDKTKDQDKISFAVELLEKVKELLNTDFESTISWIDSYEDGEYLNSMTYNHNNTIKIIDNQIKQLKEGK